MASPDEDSLWTKIINSKRQKLVDCTAITVEMITYYFQEGLIKQRDMDLMMDHRTPSQDRANQLYNILAQKDEKEEIKKITLGLEKGGNRKALRIINGALLSQEDSTDDSSNSKISSYMISKDSA